MEGTSKKSKSEEKKEDVFRDTPVRYLGYANEVGESFRAVMDVRWVYLSYAVASTYVLADTASKSLSAWRESGAPKRTFFTATDVLLWQSFASVIIPGFVINRLCKATRFLAKKTPMAKRAKWISVAVGLTSIPLIIHPIDRSVDFVMDKTLRPAMGIK